jgi:hypothetical protein
MEMAPLPEDPSFWSTVARPARTLEAAGRWIRGTAADLATRYHHRGPRRPGDLDDRFD